MDLNAKLLASRERWVESDGLRFKVRRPTDLELLRLAGKSAEDIARVFALECVVDWKLTEGDVVGGAGGSAMAAFDVELYRDWIADRVELMRVVANEVAAMVSEHREKKESAQGK